MKSAPREVGGVHELDEDRPRRRGDEGAVGAVGDGEIAEGDPAAPEVDSLAAVLEVGDDVVAGEARAEHEPVDPGAAVEGVVAEARDEDVASVAGDHEDIAAAARNERVGAEAAPEDAAEVAVRE